MSDKNRELRRRAEEIALSQREEEIFRLELPPPSGEPNAPLMKNLEQLWSEKTREMVHDLTVHQIELDLQNEELRRTQVELEAAHMKYFDLYNLAPAGYCTVSGKGFIIEANLVAATLLGKRLEELIKEPIEKFIHKEDQDIYYLHRRKLWETGQPQSCELRIVNSDGTIFWVHLATTVTEQNSVILPPASQENTETTVQNSKKSTLEKPEEEVICLLVMSDITLLKQAEEKNTWLQSKLQQSLKMESIGRLAGGVAHEFNNMLSVILGYTEMAMEVVNPAQPLFADLESIRQAAQHSSDLTRQLLTFSSNQPAIPKMINMNRTLEKILRMLGHLIGEDTELVWLPGTDLWPVKVDPSQIDQILAAFCANARDAFDARDPSDCVNKLTIVTGNLTVDEIACLNNIEALPGDYVNLMVTDNGCGMDSESMEHVFEPFFTTKEFGKGSGLGLSTVYGIVRQNNGFINVLSEPGKGTTFSVCLPRHRENNMQIEKANRAELACTGRETILVVEDDPAVLQMSRVMLEGLGYRVLTADMPSKAIRIAQEHKGDIDLLMTDVIMPEMNGLELAKKVARSILPLYPQIRCLFMSGYSAEVISHNGIFDDGAHFIQKPFSRNELAIKVREALISACPA